MEPTPRQPLPYMGDDIDRYDRRGTPFTRDRQGYDQTGTKCYRFNSLGFRGAEFADDAAVKIFVFGESHAFGGGLNEEEAWPELLARGWCSAVGLSRESACLSNFAEGGCSNGYIARAVLTQCEQVRPDLVAVEFANMNRAEVFLAGRTTRAGSWLTESTKEMLEALPNEHYRRLAVDLIRRAGAYDRFATPAHHAVDTMLNMLLVKSYCAATGIRAVASVDCLDKLLLLAATHGEVGALWSVLDDGRFLLPVSIHSNETRADRSADGSHPGPAAHRRFADELLAFLAESDQPGSKQHSRRSCGTLWLGDCRSDDGAPAAGDVDLRRSGISNAEIARELVLALASHVPERVEIRFADYRRSCSFDSQGNSFDVPPPGQQGPEMRWAFSRERRVKRERLQRVRTYNEFATDGCRVLESLRWILMTQYLLRAHRLPAVGRWHQWSALSQYALYESLAPLFAQVDHAYLSAVD